MHVMPHVATALTLNNSAMPHAPQVSDAEHTPLGDALKAVSRWVSALLRYGR